MNDKDKEAFEKWGSDEDGDKPLLEGSAYEAWQAAVEYKDKELMEWKKAARSEAQMLNEERERSKILVEALTYIAFYDEPNADKEDYWNELKPNKFATTMANDTQIAREALEKYRGEVVGNFAGDL
jgi:hypothetical protein